MVEFRGVGLTLPSGARLLRNVSFEAAPGSTTVLLGRSGAGKTTLLRLINAMARPTAGEVVVDDKTTFEWDPIELRRRTGYIIQGAGLLPHYTVARNVGLVPELLGDPAALVAERVDELLRLVDLEPRHYAERYPHELSGGQRQRVGIARALAADPPLLLCDEPFGALDPITRAELQQQFRRLREALGKTIVFVTHDVREALLLASRIVLLQDGRIAMQGTCDDFLRSSHDEARAFQRSLGAEVEAGA
jgi:osmoprotectant transport system ATP-binding protein